MNKKNVIIAIHDADNQNNILSNFANGLKKGFQQIGYQAYSTKECIEKNIRFNMAIGFNQSELQLWQKILSNDITNVMWSLDSVFGANLKVVEQFSMFEKFALFNVTPADNDAIKKYIPQLKQGYIPHAVDENFWKKSNIEKTSDIVFLGNIDDYEATYLNLKEQMPSLVYELMMQIREISLKAPQLTFWQLCETVRSALGLEFDKEQYEMLFNNLAYALKSELTVKMIQALSDFDLQIYGNELWKKYIKGKVQYLGECTVEDSVRIIEQSKISLHCHPITLGLGLHERLLNASALETFSLVSDSPSVKVEFGDSFAYFNQATFEDISDKVNYYLTNDTERLEMARKAYEITINRHTWANRAQSIIEITE